MKLRHNKYMDEKELGVVVSNEIEWRKLLFRKIETIENRQRDQELKTAMNTLKLTLFSGAFGTLGGAIFSYFIKSKGA